MKTKVACFAATVLLLGAAGPGAGAPGMAGGAMTTATAVFAGGCFWCLEADFDKLPGVVETVSGYTGGTVPNPTYHQVGAGDTGHTEAVRVRYDPKKGSYRQLVDYFWRHIDPTVKDRQFCDIGSQYRSAIFWGDQTEREIVEASRDALLKSGKLAHVYTESAKASAFYPAEDYHQNYYKKNPIRYTFYRTGCGRDDRVREIWGEK